ncbi:UDP-glycosyltransferase UGT5 isoform X1 [Drosophila gunungcola]|uniref:UDP-glycosyltransferase UGT5 isoform X1 n=1 Tax=Drosophila gunungcola TaxID=103775 RepID=UPI0022E3E87C|nr:UDP-glycosyltransferase UGT5 isoform X1 [Drosophila gunungcola]
MESHRNRWIFLALFGLALVQISQGAKILVLFPHANEGHFAVMRTLVTELAIREHTVEVYTGHGLGETLDNVTETVIPEYPFWSELQKLAAPKGNLADLGRLPIENLRQSLASVGTRALDHFLVQEPIQKLLKMSYLEFDFDVILMDYFYTEALLALGALHQRPVIGIISTDFGSYMDAVQEALVPAACSPIDFDQGLVQLGFSERLGNIRECIDRRKRFTKDHYGGQEQLVAKYFKLQHSIPELQASQLSVLLLNSHVPLMTPRVTIQQIVPAGGLHIRGPKELPWNMKRFLEEARAGVIYVQLGNEQPCGQLPKDKLEALLGLFAARKESVIWTCHDVKKLDGLPKNVMIQHAVPQIDILAHPRVKVFLTNGDLLNLQEGIVRNVPILGLPLFHHERRNVELAVRLGVGLQLEEGNVTTSSLNWAVSRLLLESHFQLTIRDVSLEFRDRPLGALANALFWVNYVARHKGGAAVRTRGIGISSCHLHLFDLFVFYAGIATLVVAMLAALGYGGFYVWNKKNNSKSTKVN